MLKIEKIVENHYSIEKVVNDQNDSVLVEIRVAGINQLLNEVRSTLGNEETNDKVIKYAVELILSVINKVEFTRKLLPTSEFYIQHLDKDWCDFTYEENIEVCGRSISCFKLFFKNEKYRLRKDFILKFIEMYNATVNK